MLTPQINIGLAFLAGMASFLAPCVLPLVPAYLGYLSGYTLSPTTQADSRTRGRVVAHAAFFVLGFSIVFILLGTAAGALGRLVRGDWLRYAGGLLLVVFGLSLTGLLHVPFFDHDTRAGLGKRRSLGFASSLLTGLAFGAGWTPCVGPVLSTILVLSADQQTLGQGVLMLAAYAAGIGLPFILAGLLVERAAGLIQRIAPYQQAIQRVVGVVIILVGVIVLTDSFSAIGTWLEGRGIGWNLGI